MAYFNVFIVSSNLGHGTVSLVRIYWSFVYCCWYHWMFLSVISTSMQWANNHLWQVRRAQIVIYLEKDIQKGTLLLNCVSPRQWHVLWQEKSLVTHGRLCLRGPHNQTVMRWLKSSCKNIHCLCKESGLHKRHTWKRDWTLPEIIAIGFSLNVVFWWMAPSNKKYVVATLKHLPSQMIWGAMSCRGAAGLWFILLDTMSCRGAAGL